MVGPLLPRGSEGGYLTGEETSADIARTVRKYWFVDFLRKMVPPLKYCG
jgi:hypothetical protein